MPRLDGERQQRLEPKRMKETKVKLEALGCIVDSNENNCLKIISPDDRNITFWPYSGWFSGKDVKDGRGFKKLLEELNL